VEDSLEAFQQVHSVRNLMSLVGKISFMGSIYLQIRPLSGLLLGLIPHHLRIDPSKHDQIIQVEKETLDLMFFLVAFFKKNPPVRHEVVGPTY